MIIIWFLSVPCANTWDPLSCEASVVVTLNAFCSVISCSNEYVNIILSNYDYHALGVHKVLIWISYVYSACHVHNCANTLYHWLEASQVHNKAYYKLVICNVIHRWLCFIYKNTDNLSYFSWLIVNICWFFIDSDPDVSKFMENSKFGLNFHD